MTPPVVDAAWVAGGVLAATGDLVAGLSVEAATERLEAALDRGGRAASWEPPDPATVTRLEDVLIQAWAAVGATLAAAGWDAAVVRLRVRDPEALAVLGPAQPPGPPVVPHAGLHARRMAWRWPLRVGVSPGDGVDGVGAVFEIVVLDGAAADAPVGVRAACVVVLDAAIGDVDPSVVDRLGAAALVVVPGSDRSWLDVVVRHLACGRPLDVAVGLAQPAATIVADDGFLELTSAAVYGRELADQLRWSEPPVDADTLATLDRLLEAPFDADGRAGEALAEVVTSVEAAGGDHLTTVERHLEQAMANGGGGHRAEPPAAEPPPPPPPPPAVPAPPKPPTRPSRIPRPAGPAPGGAGAAAGEGGSDSDDADGAAADDAGDDIDRGAAEAPPAEAAPDARRLQAEVVDPATKRVLGDRFVPGPNQVKVRIASAAAAAEGVAIADALFASPTPGRAADLTVEIIAGDTHSSQTLKLPAVKDSKWTRAMPFVVPADAVRFQLFVQVLFGGRVVQSARLDRPVLAAGAPAPAGDDGLRLAVDASTPPASVHRMTPAGASLTIVPGLTGEPQLLRLDERSPVDPDQLLATAKAIRQTLLGAFLAPPANLEAAAGVLTPLAVHGSLLRDHLEADAYDDVDWIHVSTFGAVDLPVELVYTHQMPDSDVKVPVCPTALAGADRCAGDCPDRTRSDVVCPFGFWATSKVVERRQHTDDRNAAKPGVERSISVLSVGAAGVSKKADEVDPTSTSRIVEAVRKAVAAGAFHPLAKWDDLKTVAALPARVLVLVTHTIEGAAGDVLGTKLQLGTDDLSVHRIRAPYINPADTEPGPVVLAIGCDTGDLEASFSGYVELLFRAGAELVVSAISPVPGKNVADFVERFFAALPAYLATPGIHRFGEVLTAVRRRTVADGDVLALALTATGDADVALVGA